MDSKNLNKRIWILIAQVSGIFAFVISGLLIVNYIQYKTIDPVDTEIVNTLIQRLNENPDDQSLREQVRTMDLLSRKAYFTNQWQVRTGGYLLLISIGIMIIAMQLALSNTQKQSVIDPGENIFIKNKVARKTIIIMGLLLLSTAIVTGFLTHDELSRFPNNDIAKNETNILETNIEIQQAESEKVVNDDTISLNKTIADNNQISSEANPEPETLVDEEETKIPAKETIAQPEKNIDKQTSKKTAEAKDISYPSESELLQNHNSFRGYGGNGISAHTNIPTNWDGSTGENICWTATFPLSGFNSPIIWNNDLFLSGANSEQRQIYCLDRFTGKLKWTYDVTDVPGSPKVSPKVTDDTGLAAPSLTTDGKRVYGLFGNGDLVALDMSGKKLWSRNLGETGNHYGHSSSLYLYRNVLLVQYDTKSNPRVMGIQSSDGETLWETKRDVRLSWASPIVVNTGTKTEVILVADPGVASYDPITGNENWQIDCVFGEVGPSAAYSDGIVFAVNEYAILSAIKISDNPEIIWETDEYLSDVPSPIAYNGLLFIATSYGSAACYDASSGEKYWEHDFDDGFYSSPMLAEGKIYLTDMQGTTHILKAQKTFEIISQPQLGESCVTTPAFADGKIYIRGNKQLYCIGK